MLLIGIGESTVEELSRELEERGYQVTTEPTVHALLARETWPALVLLDPSAMPPAVLSQVVRHPRRGDTTLVVWQSADSEDRPSLGHELGADDIVDGRWTMADVAARLELAARRARRLLETSPLTGLPGNLAIRRQLARRAADGGPLAVIYSDLDEFKAFNDRYGFIRGDDVIRFCADCLRHAAVVCGDDSVFVGHVGGDDFVVLLRAESTDAFCDAAIAAWEQGIGAHYDATDRQRGHIVAVDRHGNAHKYPIASLSLGVATNRVRSFASPWHAAAVASEMKEYAKKQPGSNYQVDRRA